MSTPETRKQDVEHPGQDDRLQDDHARSARPQDRTPILTARQLEKTVGSGSSAITILHALDLEIHAGESVAIVGSSGSGKSTLLALLAGLDTLTHGELDLFGEPLSSLDEDGRARLRAGQVGFVFQNFQLLPTLTALENVLLPLELSDHNVDTDQARQWLVRVGLEARVQHLPKQLSGGEQQRVAIARAFVTRPALVFADEPTGNLDRATGDRVADLLFTLNRESGTTLVLVTHDPRLAARCDRTLTLDEGRLHVRGPDTAALRHDSDGVDH
ncbi:ABC transporter ATP-binding protein [Kushneria sp. Sum13]|uniref:ABC transporter ATP-binding protein n=1 Tax=Kushneria sp. Sum13 TaxID=3459196 RepID=UPI00404618D0